MGRNPAALIKSLTGALGILLAALVLSCLKPIGFSDNPSQNIPDIPGFINITGIVPAANGTPVKEVSPAKDYMGKISWSPDIPASGPYANHFEPFRDYTAVIELFMGGGRPLPPAGISVTVEGALSAGYSAAAGTVTAVFPRTSRPVDNETDLKNAILALPALPALTAPNKNIIELTGIFYDSVKNNTSPLYIGIGDDNNIPYTIRGQGKFSTHKLAVGILLANNNITLEDMRIEITESGKGVLRQWTPTLSYRAAVLIGRYKTDSGPGSPFTDGLGSKNVTVKNCSISFSVNNSMIAGILISDGTSQNVVSVDNSIIAAESDNASYAAQALLIYRYDPGISITGNGLTAKNNPSTSQGNPSTCPAAAIFMHILPDIGNSYTPLISGNTINGNPTYDFYINILNYPANNRTVIPALVENKFATRDSTWMTAASTDTGSNRSFYKKLLDVLINQSRGGAGYGYLAMNMNAANDFVYECYYRQSNRLWAIDFWGYNIVNGAYTSNEVRSRLLLNDNGLVYEKNAQFHWTRDIAGNAGNNGENIPKQPPSPLVLVAPHINRRIPAPNSTRGRAIP